jgi:hypothetical protein
LTYEAPLLVGIYRLVVTVPEYLFAKIAADVTKSLFLRRFLPIRVNTDFSHLN